MGEPFLRASASGVRLVVRVTPNAGVDRIEGVETRVDGQAVLRVRVRAVPDRGKANAAVAALLADALRLPKSAITLLSGETSRLKTLEIAGDAAALTARIATLVAPAD